MVLELLDYSKSQEILKIIKKKFHFDKKKELVAQDLLFQFRKKFDVNELILVIKEALRKKQYLFFGAGPNLESSIIKIKKEILNRRKKFFLIAADGASIALKQHEIIPDLIVTDLDGLNPFYFKEFISKDVFFCVLAHGDNINLLREFKSLLVSYNKIIGTCQIENKYPIINTGGFTDGDRGICLVNQLIDPEEPFFLIGYNFNNQIGSFSKLTYIKSQEMTKNKKNKLEICKNIISYIAKKEKRKIIYLGKYKEIESEFCDLL